MTDNSTSSPKPTPSGRSRARRNVIGRSPNRDEYVRMMESGWSSMSIERYAAYRYGEDIPAATVRTYRVRHKIEARQSPIPNTTADQTVDVVGKRAELIALQERRIAIDVKHEEQMSKLFGSTKGEIALLTQLLTEHKGDLQDLGLMPKAGEKIEITGGRPAPGEVPTRARTLGELLGSPGASPEMQMEMARVLHLSTKAAAKTDGSATG